MPSAFDFEGGDEMSYEQTLEYYKSLNKSYYGRIVPLAEFKKFWSKAESKGAVNSDKRIKWDEILKFNLQDWESQTIMLQDQKVTVYEVEETFPTMFNLQKVVKRLVSRISGVEQESIKW